jgi:hypothetical protein
MAHKLPPSHSFSIFNSEQFSNDTLRPTITINNTYIEEKFNGDMEGKSITNVKSISRPIHTQTVTEPLYFSITDHLDATTFVQVKITENGTKVRTICFIVNKTTASGVTSNEISDSNPSHSSNISIGSWGTLTIYSNTECVAEISTLCLG